MGAWGHNYFENDAALDFMGDIEESDDPKGTIERILREVTESEYLDSDEASGAIVAAAYIDRQLTGTLYSATEEGEPLAVDTFPERHPNTDLKSLAPDAIASLEKVLSDGSELNELWAESEEDHSLWRTTIENLINRLRMNSR